jgi:hypothetical protein
MEVCQTMVREKESDEATWWHTRRVDSARNSECANVSAPACRLQLPRWMSRLFFVHGSVFCTGECATNADAVASTRGMYNPVGK